MDHSMFIFLFFFSIFSSGGHSCTVERNGLSNFCTGSWEEHYCEIILKSIHQHEKKCHSKFFFPFLALDAILFSGAETF